MPAYRRRTLADFPTEVYKCPANPEGLEFICYFCTDNFKTKSASISHMKICCKEQDMEYSDDTEIMDGFTILDAQRNHTAFVNTLKQFITSNALEVLADRPSSIIMQTIQDKLSENGFTNKDIYLHPNMPAFNIYQFFFDVPDEETKEFYSICSNKISSMMSG